jgi:hypothetical protein
MNYLRFNSQGELLFTYREKDYTINTIHDWEVAMLDILGDDPDQELESFQCSSSIDFPEEYTDDQELIELCYRIRSC